MRLRRLVPLLALAALGLRIGAASLEAGRMSFSPPSFGVGELVEAVVEVSPSRGEPEPFEFHAGKELPAVGERDDPEIRSIKLARVGLAWELRIRFVPWSPGAGRLAPRSAAGSLLPAIPYSVASPLGPSDQDLAPSKPQREPPGSALYLYGFAGFFLLLALLGGGTLFWVLPGALSLLERRRAALAYRRLLDNLAFLEASLAGKGPDASPRGSSRESAETLRQAAGGPEAFYAALARSFRLYLAARVLPEVSALTPREIAGLDPERFPAEGLKEETAALLAESDDVRFGGELPGRESMLRAIESARRIGKTIEETLA